VSDLQGLLGRFVSDGLIPGVLGLVTRGDRIEWATAGSAEIGGAPMARESIFRIGSITKPITAATLMTLVEDGRVALEDPVGEWLPELAQPAVVRTPGGAVDDVVPASRPMTIFDLLSSQAGYGFPSNFSLPAVSALFPVQRDGREPQAFPPPDEWIAGLTQVPLLYQPGEAWLYDTCSTLQGVLISRITGQSLPDVMAERVFEPLGMVDTGFVVPIGKLDRLTSYYRTGPSGDFELADGPRGQWSTMPAFPLGNGGLASTVDDWLAFGRMLLAEGSTMDGRRVLSGESVRLMTSDHTTAAQREIGRLFLEGQGWGFGGSVDIAPIDPWNVPGRYGWVGGTSTSAHVTPSTGAVAILLTQVAMSSPVAPQWMRDFWRYAAG
jgi:CubicO group peptidase (beta-lactamase class C family)